MCKVEHSFGSFSNLRSPFELGFVMAHRHVFWDANLEITISREAGLVGFKGSNS